MGDFVRGLPGIRYLRKLLWGSSRRPEYEIQGKSPLLDLPDEVLLIIVESLLPRCGHRHCTRDVVRRGDIARLSKTKKRMYHITARFLYQDIALVHGWSRTNRALAMIASSPLIARHAKTFKLALSIESGTKLMPTTAVESKLSALLPMLARLRTLHLDVPAKYAHRFSTEFGKAHLCLPDVRSVVLSPYMEFVIAHCPGLESISSLDFLDEWSRQRRMRRASDPRENTTALIQAAGSVVRLQEVYLHESWQPSLLRTVHDHLPHLSSLAMLGCLAYPHTPTDILPALKRFTSLRQLVLPWLEDLNIDFRQPGMCGNRFLGPGGSERWRQVCRRRDKEAIKAATPTAQVAFRELPILERLWFGHSMLFIYELKPTLVGKVRYMRQERPQPATLRY